MGVKVVAWACVGWSDCVCVYVRVEKGAVCESVCLCPGGTQQPSVHK